MSASDCRQVAPGIVSWWSAENNGLDRVGVNNASLRGGATFGPGNVGQAFVFNGLDASVHIPAAPSLNVGVGHGFTVEAWINPASVTREQPIFEWSDSFSFQTHLWISVPEEGNDRIGSVYANIKGLDSQDNSFRSESGIVKPQEWQHIVLTYDRASGAGVLYHNGLAVAQRNLGSLTPSTFGDLSLGHRPSGAGTGIRFSGQIDEPGVYGRALTADEILGIFTAGSSGKCDGSAPGCLTPPLGIVGWWSAENNGADWVGGNTALLGGGTSYETGKVGHAFVFNGTDADVRIPASSTLDVGKAPGLSIEAWIKPMDVNEQQNLFEWNSGAIGAHITIAAPGPHGAGAGSLYANLIDTTGQYHYFSTASGELAAGVWQHVAVTYDKASGSGAIYINGVLTAAQALGQLEAATSQDLFFGVRPAGAPGLMRYSGQMDEPAVYARALSAAEVEAIYLAGSAGKCGASSGCASVAPGALAWWGGEGNTVDYLGAANGVARGDANFGPGKVGQAFLFDGQGDEIMVPQKPKFNGLVQFTIEFWMKATPDNIIGSADQGLVTTEFFGIETGGAGPRSGIFVFASTDGNTFAHSADVNGGGAIVTSGEWHHIAGTYDGTGLQLFVDGQPRGQAAPLQGTIPAMLAQSYISIGSEDGRTTCGCARYFKGEIDEPAIYSRALSPAEIKAIFMADSAGKCVPTAPGECVSAPNGLVSWWSGEGTPLDRTGANHGTLIGNTTFGTGLVGSAFVLDGSGDAIDVGNPAGLQLQTFTIEAWIKRGSATQVSQDLADAVIFGYAWGGYALALHNDGRLLLTKVGYSGVSSTLAVTDTDFHHVAVTKSGANIVFYLDGVAQTAEPYDPGFVFNGSAVIGARGDDYVGSFIGTIDEVAVYNRPLLAAEIQAIYGAGSAGKCVGEPTCAAARAGLIHWWRAETNPLDIVGGLNGTLLDGATFAVGKVGTAFSFDGDKDGITNSTPGLTNILNTFSYEFWAWPAAARAETGQNTSGIDGISGQRYGIFPEHIGGPLVGTGVSVGTNGVSVFEHGSVQMPALLVYNAPITNWTHIVVVYSDRQPSLYLDGVLVHTGLQSVNPCFPSTWLGGADFPPYNYGFYAGLLDEVSIYSRALSATEVQALFAAQEFGKCLPAGPPAIVRQPASASVTAGDTATFSVQAAGALPLFYQWSYNNTAIVGATNAVLIIPNVTAANAGSYLVRITNSVGFTESAAAILTVTPVPTYPPTVTLPPFNRTVNAGSTVSFAVSATGTEPLRYQWFHDGTVIADATNTTLMLSNVQLNQAGEYRVTITNDYGFAQSTATLTVNPAPSTVRVQNVSAASGGTVVVPITITANGEENALGFTLSFTPARLTFQSAELGSGITGGSLILNTTGAANGRVGFLVSTEFGKTIAPGTQQVARVYFSTAPSTFPVTTFVSFLDDPIARQVADVNGDSLPSLFTSGTVTLLASEYEGDAAPRPFGDRQLGVTDWVTVGRFAANLENTTNSSEFRRVDCAPRSTLGDGTIGLTDWVQAGRYAAKLDPLTYAGGPELPSGFAPAALPRKLSLARQIKVIDTALVPGASGTLKVQLQAQGDENAVGFSMAFDPAALEYEEASLSENVPSGTILQVNSADAAAGKLAVLIAAQPGVAFSPGATELIKLTLRASSAASGSTTVALTDQPVKREISDLLAESLPAEFINGSALIAPAPSLSIVANGEVIRLTWPAWATNYVLQAAPDLSGPGVSWTNVPVSMEIIGGEASVTLPTSEAAGFYRLQQPH